MEKRIENFVKAIAYKDVDGKVFSHLMSERDLTPMGMTTS